MSSLILKIIALISMTIDHIGYIFYPDIYIFRFIGRIAFPIFAFLLVQGFLKTKDNPNRIDKYFKRLLAFALVSEVFHDLAFYGSFIYIKDQNAIFTLFLGLCSLYLSDELLKKGHKSFYPAILFAIIAYLLKTDYEAIGIIIIYIFYYGNKISNTYLNKLYLFSSLFLISLYKIIEYSVSNKYLLSSFYSNYSWIYLGIPLSLIPILIYNEKYGINNKKMQLFFYIYYPLHLFIMFIIKRY